MKTRGVAFSLAPATMNELTAKLHVLGIVNYMYMRFGFETLGATVLSIPNVAQSHILYKPLAGLA
eukprot:2529077-Amphidinium_carterae.1